jgi:predicted transcriptional regulator
MSPKAKEILQHGASWPEDDQDELAEVARDIEARRTGAYRLSDEERQAAIKEGLADARSGRFASDDDIDAIVTKARSAK